MALASALCNARLKTLHTAFMITVFLRRVGMKRQAEEEKACGVYFM